MRLNKGVRGRLIDHCNYLIKQQALKGRDAKFIYDNTKKLEYEKPDYQDYVIDISGRKPTDDKFAHHDMNVSLRNYLEKIKY